MSIAAGKKHEDQALVYLKKKGLTLVERNYLTRFGEIDLIMQTKNTLIFVEVRYRHSAAFGSACDSVTPHKQEKLVRTAEHFLQKKQLTDKIATRFDVVAMQPQSLQWIKNAFSA